MNAKQLAGQQYREIERCYSGGSTDANSDDYYPIGNRKIQAGILQYSTIQYGKELEKPHPDGVKYHRNFERCWCHCEKPNNPSSATRPAGGVYCNGSAMDGFAGVSFRLGVGSIGAAALKIPEDVCKGTNENEQTWKEQFPRLPMTASRSAPKLGCGQANPHRESDAIPANRVALVQLSQLLPARASRVGKRQKLPRELQADEYQKDKCNAREKVAPIPDGKSNTNAEGQRCKGREYLTEARTQNRLKELSSCNTFTVHYSNKV